MLRKKSMGFVGLCVAMTILTAAALSGGATPSENETISPTLATVPVDVSAGWWSKVRRDIVESEYHVTWQDSTVIDRLSAAWQAPNRAHDLRTLVQGDARAQRLGLCPCPAVVDAA